MGIYEHSWMEIDSDLVAHEDLFPIAMSRPIEIGG